MADKKLTVYSNKSGTLQKISDVYNVDRVKLEKLKKVGFASFIKEVNPNDE